MEPSRGLEALIPQDWSAPVWVPHGAISPARSCLTMGCLHHGLQGNIRSDACSTSSPSLLPEWCLQGCVSLLSSGSCCGTFFSFLNKYLWGAATITDVLGLEVGLSWIHLEFDSVGQEESFSKKPLLQVASPYLTLHCLAFPLFASPSLYPK